LSRPFSPRSSPPGSFFRINGKIRAREVRVIGVDGKQLGVLTLNDALGMARTHGVDLVEIAATANPPVCRLVDFGKFRYEQAKKEKESKKHQHATQVKEIQLSPRIDPHDLSIKVTHAVNFLCEDMKVKVALKFRGREMAHTEFGFQVIKKFIVEIAPFGHPDFEPKLVGRSINLMISPLPRNKRAKNPHQPEGGPMPESEPDVEEDEADEEAEATPPAKAHKPAAPKPGAAKPEAPAFENNPPTKLDANAPPESPAA
jgi:translation initiation factor IF-3